MLSPDPRRSRWLVALAAWAGLCLPLSPLAAQDGEPDEEIPASDEVLFLLLPVGAQGVALGRAMTAFESQEAAFWNPAGLAGVEQSRALVYRGTTLAGEQTAVSAVISRGRVGTFGVSYQLLNIGDQELRDIDNRVLGSISVRSHLGVASFATRLGRFVQTGINFKLVQFRLSCRGQCVDGGIDATTYAVDAGVQLTPVAEQPLRFGAMIAHAGPRLQVVNAEQADPLPTRLRIAVAYEVLDRLLDNPNFRLWTSLEIEDRWRDLGSPTWYLGAELAAGQSEVLFVRAGYVYSTIEEVRQTEGAAVGLGLRYDRFDLGIARSVTGRSLGPESEPVYLTLGLAF